MVNDNDSVRDEQFEGDEKPLENKESNSVEETSDDLKSEVNKVDTVDSVKEDSVSKPESEEVSSDHFESEDSKVDPSTEKQESEQKQPEAKSEVKETSEENKTEEEKIDYSTLGKEALVNTLDNLLMTKAVDKISNDVDIIKVLFYKQHKVEVESLKKKFVDEGGVIEDFKSNPEPLEIKLKDLLNKFRTEKAGLNRKIEEDKIANLETKNKVIEGIKELVNRKESINKTFHEFRDLQQTWRDTGLVPQQNVKDLWESYHLACEMFYDYININKELRDLDLKKNLEAKLQLCEKAEKLLVEPSVIQAFKTLQSFHDQWREIGPVPNDKKDELWQRFKEITSKINKRHHEYFEGLKANQKKNLEEKTVLCEKVEEMNTLTLSSAKEWEAKSKEIIEIQKVWKTIGFAPKKDNNKVYARFREACDVFFNRKREFFNANKEEQKNNLQIKTDLCVQAEALKDSEDWRNTTETLINLQKKWKQIGPVPRKYSDQVWERFRSACDAFFERKSNFFSNKDSSFDENLKKKLELIDEVEKYEMAENVDSNFEKISLFQKQWTEIGYVPMKSKDEVQNKFRAAINALYDKLKVDEGERNILKYNNKLIEVVTKTNPSQKLKQERDKLIKKLNALESDIVVWENNIGFFANSKNAGSLIKDVESKIKNGKESAELLKEKIRAIDSFKNDNNIY